MLILEKGKASAERTGSLSGGRIGHEKMKRFGPISLALIAFISGSFELLRLTFGES